jgi:diguanylate cyclase (GGDEF)-like protein/PAS domain S-box-containing protein
MLNRPLQSLVQAIKNWPVARKLWVIYGLNVGVVGVVCGILVTETLPHIDLARSEQAGNAYIGAVAQGMQTLPVPLGSASPVQLRNNQAQDAVAALRLAEQAWRQTQAASPSLSEAQVELVLAWQALPQQGPLSIESHAQVNDAARNLIAAIGRQSGLLVDPELDSYYTMSLLVLRYPELLELVHQEAQKAMAWAQSPPAAVKNFSNDADLLVLQAKLLGAAKAASADHAEALNTSGQALAPQLTPSHVSLERSLTALMRPLEAGSAAPVTALQRLHQDAATAVAQAWAATRGAMQSLLQARIDRLYQRLAQQLVAVGAFLVLVFVLVRFIARQISEPLRVLAQVAQQVSRSGDALSSVRMQHHSVDEIGQLVHAFNRMLDDLDRNQRIGEDLTATQRAEAAQRALVESLPAPLILTALSDQRVLHANPSALPWLQGLTHDPWAQCLDGPTRERFLAQLQAQGQVDSLEVRWCQADQNDSQRLQPSSTDQWALLSSRRIAYQGQAALLTSLSPVSQMKWLENRLQLWGKVFESSSESIVVFDVDGRLLSLNPAFTRHTGWTLQEVSERSAEFLYAPRHSFEFCDRLWKASIIRGHWQGEVWLLRKDDSEVPTWLNTSVVRNAQGQITHLVMAALDITAHKANEARIHHLAHHDALTDLPNRSLCLERLRMSINQASRNGAQVAVVFIDLDRFKNINDSMGHHVGDALLQSVAKRLLDAVRPSDTVCRLGGDEFVIVLGDIKNRQEIDDIVVRRVVPLICEPHVVEGKELHVSCSAGVAVYPQDGLEIDYLMRHADAAMYQAKAAGRNQAVFFTPEFHARTQERLALEYALRGAHERGELLLHYQPRIHAHSGQLVGVEALLRWMHPQLGMVSPTKFIPIAEETQLINPIGAWIVGEVCRQHAAWRDAGVGHVPISVNVSPIQLREARLPEVFTSAFALHRVDAAAIEVELTETFLMDNALATVERLKLLKATGVTLSIDDFGTGYSSLNYLHQFPIDKLKIDQSFVRDMLHDPADRAITQAIIGLGHTLGLKVVAEGVEHAEEEALLRQYGCDELQGFLYGRPMAVDVFERWLLVDAKRPWRTANTEEVAAALYESQEL